MWLPLGAEKAGLVSGSLPENSLADLASVLSHPPSWAPFSKECPNELGEVVTLRNTCFAGLSCEGDHPAGCHLPSGEQSSHSHTHTVCPRGARSATLPVRLARLGRRKQEPTARLQIRSGRLEDRHTPLTALCILGVSPPLIWKL